MSLFLVKTGLGLEKCKMLVHYHNDLPLNEAKVTKIRHLFYHVKNFLCISSQIVLGAAGARKSREKLEKRAIFW